MNDEYDDLAEMYRPQGMCAHCGKHTASELWFHRVGSQAFTFRCACCMAKGRLQRALEYQKRIPKLERELEDAESKCGLVQGE
jgi:hypothetical protein